MHMSCQRNIRQSQLSDPSFSHFMNYFLKHYVSLSFFLSKKPQQLDKMLESISFLAKQQQFAMPHLLAQQYWKVGWSGKGLKCMCSTGQTGNSYCNIFKNIRRSTLETCIKCSNTNAKTLADLPNHKLSMRDVVGQATIPIWLPDTPLWGCVYAINYTWQLRIILLPWKKQTKLCKRGALSEATVLRLVINHIWRNIKGKGGNWLQH